MRALWLGGVAVVAGGLFACAQPSEDATGWNGSQGAQDDWADDAATEYFGRFGGTIDMGDDGEVTVDEPEGAGEEYAIITDSTGTLQCEWRWTTDAWSASTGGVEAGCDGCAVAWDVTCYDGHEAGGSCRGWIDTDAAQMDATFQLAFEPTETIDGVEHGVVYIRDSAYDKWSPYSYGTRQGTLVTYEYVLSLF